jgi:hypothetical protein
MLVIACAGDEPADLSETSSLVCSGSGSGSGSGTCCCPAPKLSVALAPSPIITRRGTTNRVTVIVSSFELPVSTLVVTLSAVNSTTHAPVAGWTIRSVQNIPIPSTGSVLLTFEVTIPSDSATPSAKLRAVATNSGWIAEAWGAISAPDGCIGLQCQVVDCAAIGMQPTTLAGTVFAPNETLPLHGVDVYIPLGDPGVPSNTLACDRCGTGALPGGAVARTTSRYDGTFRLENVPSGDNIPLVIKSGKWQRAITIPHVEPCIDTPLAAASTSLPKTSAEGNIPKIAISTGNAEALECLVRKLGLDQEMTTSTGGGRIHLYAGNGVQTVGATPMQSAQTLWNDANALAAYDIVMLSCEGSQNPQTKPQTALDAMKAYADAGGRVYASHWHNIWIAGSFQSPFVTPAVWSSIAAWSSASFPGNPVRIDEASNPKGTSLANWLFRVGASGPTLQTRGHVALQDGRITALAVDTTRAERWMYEPATDAPQSFQFTTPNEAAPVQRCGKVMFSEIHASAHESWPIDPFPNACSSAPLTDQEKVAAFMFFDLATCVRNN